MLRGTALIGIFFENCMGYVYQASSPPFAVALVETARTFAGPFVQLFFVLSGFGLTLSYLRRDEREWSWRTWAWRRFTKIVVPYEILVVVSFALGLIGSRLHDANYMQSFSWPSFISYVTFTRNFYPASWIWNPPLWFMPVIVGLYVSFPLLLQALERWGPRALLAISAAISFGTLTVAVLASLYRGHGGVLFTFWTFEFALGMVLAQARVTAPERLRLLLGIGPFTLGLAAMALSWVLRTYVPLGGVFNDAFTTVGVFLVLLNAVWVLRAAVPAVGRALAALSGPSYLMYLVHYPLMMFLIGPPPETSVNPILAVAVLAVYIVLVYWLCMAVSVPMDRVTTSLYRRGMGWSPSAP